jgi:hypothetical protein
MPKLDLTDVYKFIYEYQALIAGILALLGACRTVRVINKQIRKSGEIEDERRRRQNLAARTVMPVALTELIDYSDASLVFLAKFTPDEYGLPKLSGPADVPAVPSEAMLTLRLCIEFGETAVAEAISDLISKIQIQYSRLDTIKNWSDEGKLVTQSNLNTYTVDALEVHARAARLFPYARRDETFTPLIPSADDIRQAARSRDISQVGELYTMISTWQPKLLLR